MSVYEAMGAVLERWRGEMSYGALSRASGVSIPTVIDACRGVRTARPETLTAIVSALGKTEADLMREMADAAGNP